MPPLSRRTLFGTAAAGIVTVAATGADAQPQQEPAALLGAVTGDRVTLPPLHAPSEQEDTVPNREPAPRRLGVAVVGLGHLALTEILPGFGTANDVRLAALVSGERNKALAIAAQYGVPDTGIYDYGNFDQIKNNPAVDIVYIVLPNSMHMEYTVRAAQAGKHVLCEKPMATSVADAQRMIDACRDAGRKLMIAYRMQYEPHNRALIGITRGGQYGKPQLIQAVNGQNDLPNGQWRQIKAMAGGGSLPDVGLYCLNAARYLTGEEPVELTAQITQPKDDPRFREIEDVCAFTMRFPSGVMASLTSGYSFHDSRWMRVNLQDAWAELSPAFGYSGIALQVGQKVGRGNGVQRIDLGQHNQFAREMDHFAQAIRAGVEPHTPGAEGLQDQKIIELLYQAAAGGGVVKLPASTGLDVTRGPPPQQEG